MYLVQNLTCLGIAGLAVIPAFLVLAVRFSAFTKVQLFVLTGGFIVAGFVIAAMVNTLAGAVPCLFPALFFALLGLLKHGRDMKLAQRSLETATARAQAPAVRPPAKSSPDSSSLDLPDFD